MEIKIFLFTFVYNDRKHISRLFNSIENQNSKNFIYYLYDDCSTQIYDDLYNSLKEKLNEKNIQTYFEKGNSNLGINKATEHCLKVMKKRFGECSHFMWINSDDWLENNAIERLTLYIKKYPNRGIYMFNLRDYIEETKNFIPHDNVFKNSKNFIIDSLYSRQIFSHFMADAKLFTNINPDLLIYFDVNYKNFYNDVCVLFLFSAFNIKSIFINEYLSNYLIKENNSSLITMENNRNKLLFLKPMADYIKSININYYPTYNKIIRISFTHIVCKNLVEAKKYRLSMNYYKKNKILFKELKIDKNYLYPQPTSFILFKFPRMYLLIHKIKLKIFNRN